MICLFALINLSLSALNNNIFLKKYRRTEIMYLKKLLTFGFAVMLCTGIICACGGRQAENTEQIITDSTEHEQINSDSAEWKQIHSDSAEQELTNSDSTEQEQKNTDAAAEEQMNTEITKKEQMNTIENENITTDSEAASKNTDAASSENIDAAASENTDTAASETQDASSPAPDAEGMASGFSENPDNSDDGSAAEELPTDENGIVFDCPKAVSEKRPGMDYGTVTHITYYSETTGCERGANILLPAGYTEEKKYPVAYFQHGIFGDEYGLINDANNRIREIFGNLAADGLTRECIVVFTNMYATGDPALKPGFNAEQIAPYDNFINDLINDLMPFMEKNYSILTGRENTGLIGFSMGGRESLYTGLVRPDLFAHTCGISPAPGLTPGRDWAMTHVGQLSEAELVFPSDKPAPELYMICCGTADSVVGSFPKSYHDILTENGTGHIWYEIPGADHDNRAIRSGIYNFLIRWNN